MVNTVVDEFKLELGAAPPGRDGITVLGWVVEDIGRRLVGIGIGSANGGLGEVLLGEGALMLMRRSLRQPRTAY